MIFSTHYRRNKGKQGRKICKTSESMESLISADLIERESVTTTTTITTTSKARRGKHPDNMRSSGEPRVGVALCSVVTWRVLCCCLALPNCSGMNTRGKQVLEMPRVRTRVCWCCSTQGVSEVRCGV